MRIKILILIMFFSFMPVNACNVTCPSSSLDIIEKESFINNVTGLNFSSKKIAQTIIQKEINESLNSKIKANIEIFNIKRLKKGEFKSLTLKSKNIKYKAFSMSDFYAQTICPFNRVIYKKGRIYYPLDLAFKYKGSITNQDIQNIINSKEFQEELIEKPLKISNIKLLELKSLKVLIKDNKLYFNLEVKSLFGKTAIKFFADIEVKNNKIVLKNITFNSKNNMISDNILSPLIDKINPVTYEINSLNGKYCKIFITKAKISDNIIDTEGVFIINKNYNGEK